MRCDRCGGEIPPGQVTENTKSEQIDPPGRFGARTKTVLIKVCPSCAAKEGCVVQAAIVIFLLLLMGVIVSWLF